jgi:hypothetical protein
MTKMSAIFKLNITVLPADFDFNTTPVFCDDLIIAIHVCLRFVWGRPVDGRPTGRVQRRSVTAQGIEGRGTANTGADCKDANGSGKPLTMGRTLPASPSLLLDDPKQGGSLKG